MMAPRHTVCLTGALDRPDDCRASHGPCERRRPRSLNGQRRARGFRGVFLDASRSRHEVFRPRTYRTARPVRLDIVVAPAFDPRLSSPLTTFEPCLCMWMDISFSRSGAGRDRFSRAGQCGGGGGGGSLSLTFEHPSPSVSSSPQQRNTSTVADPPTPQPRPDTNEWGELITASVRRPAVEVRSNHMDSTLAVHPGIRSTRRACMPDRRVRRIYSRGRGEIETQMLRVLVSAWHHRRHTYEPVCCAPATNQ
jgi:hypothetical protein